MVSASEDTVSVPSTHYGLSKLILEERINDLGNLFGIKTVNLRVPLLLVPGVQNNFLVNWIKAAKLEKTVFFSNPTGKFNNLGDARTIFNVIKYLTNVEFNFNEINICSSDLVSIKELTKFSSSFSASDVHFEEKQQQKKLVSKGCWNYWYKRIRFVKH